MAVNPIPAGYHTVTPYLVVRGVPSLIEFVQQTFDAQEIVRMARPDGIVMHAEVRIGDSMVMMGEHTGDSEPKTAMLYVYVEDVDTVYQRAVAAGGVSISEPANQFYGDRHGGVKDAFGNQWWIATHVEDVPPDEMARRSAAYGQSHG